MNSMSTSHVEDLTTMPSLSLVDSPVSLPSSDGFVSINSDGSPVTVVERDEIPSESSAISIQEADSVAILAKSMKSTTPMTRNEYKLDEESDWVNYQLHLLDRLWHNIQSEDVITLIRDEPEIGEVIESRRIMTFQEKRSCRLRYAMIPDGEAIKYMLNTVKTIVRQRRQGDATLCTSPSAIAAPPLPVSPPPLPTIVITPPPMVVQEKQTFETCPPKPPRSPRTSLTSVQLPLIDEHVREKMENILQEVATVSPSIPPTSTCSSPPSSTPPCPPPLPLSVVQSMSRSIRPSLPSAHWTTTNDVKKPSFVDELANALKKRKEKVESSTILVNDTIEIVKSVATVINNDSATDNSETLSFVLKKNETAATSETSVTEKEETVLHSRTPKKPSSMEKSTPPTVMMIGDISDMCPASWLPVEKVTPRPYVSSMMPVSSRRLLDASTQTNSVVIFDVAPEHDYQDVTTTTSEFHFDSVSQSVEKTRARRQAAFFPDITRALSNVQLTSSPVATATQQYSKMTNMYSRFN